MGGCAHIYSAMANAGAPDAADPAAAALGQDLGAANAVGLANAAQGGLHNLAMPLAQWHVAAGGGQAGGGGALAADAADAAGAQPSEGYETTTESLDIATRTWSRQAPMPQARRAFAADVLKDGRVIVAGGATQHDVFLKSVFAFNPRSGTWEELASMPSCRCSCSGNVIGDGRFIIAGGYSEPADEEGALNGWLSSCLAYEPKDNSWSTLRSMPTPRADHATAAVACSLFVVRDQPPCCGWRDESVSDELVLRWVASIGRTRAVFGPWKCWTPQRSAGTGCPT